MPPETFAPPAIVYQGHVYQATPTTLHLVVQGSVALFGSDPPLVVAAGDTLTLDLWVELA